MSTILLGRLERVDLRETWSSESTHFTPWLAQETNLALLSETIGIELELEAQEQYVGQFRADLLCKDTSNDTWVLVENQLERTDHSHLGQLITYAAGLSAVTIVWIAQRFTDEHRAALDWLNEHTATGINLFGLEVELWRIGDSLVAPKFNVISQPNDWSRTVQEAARSTGELTELRKLQLRFWTAFRTYMEQKRSFVKCQQALPSSTMTHSIGRTGARLFSVISSWNSDTAAYENEIRAELYLDGPNAKQEFAILEGRKAEIEGALGFPLTWRNPANKAMCRFYIRQTADFSNEQLWDEQFEWLRQKQETLHRIFAPFLREIRVLNAELPMNLGAELPAAEDF